MKIFPKILSLTLVLTIYSVQSLANPVFYIFKHLAATSAKEPGLGKATLHVRAWCTGHDIQSTQLPLGQSYQDHMSGSWITGWQQLIFECTTNTASGTTSTMHVQDFYVLDSSIRKVEISASCPVDEKGNLLAPSDIYILQSRN
jgi:hypothetical protein